MATALADRAQGRPISYIACSRGVIPGPLQTGWVMSAGVSYTLGSLTLDQVDFIHNVPVSVLVAAVRGHVDLNRIAAEELANRGYGRDGVWVGFRQARDQHLQAVHAEVGRMSRFTGVRL